MMTDPQAQRGPSPQPATPAPATSASTVTVSAPKSRPWLKKVQSIAIGVAIHLVGIFIGSMGKSTPVNPAAYGPTVTVIPIWAIWLLSVGSPLVTAAVVVVCLHHLRKEASSSDAKVARAVA